MDVKDIIAKRRKELGLTLEQIGNAIGVGKSTVAKWERGDIKNMRRDNIAKLAGVLQISPLLLTGCADSDSKTQWLEKNKIPVENSEFFAPVLGHVRAGLGGLAEQEVIGREPLPAHYARTSEDYFWLMVDGDSMAPMLQPGDMILVKAMTSVDSGSLGVVMIDGEEGVVKKVVYGPDWIELRSFNPYYPTRRFEGENVLAIRVVGKVIESKRKY